VLGVLGLGLTAGVVAGLPYFDIPSLNILAPIGKNLPLQPFGMIVAVGVLIGASVMRRYAERHGADDGDLRGLTGWITVCGFIGAHVFDVLMYQQAALAEDPLLLIKLWQGISSYGGFIGGSAGFAFYVWWKRLTPGFWADAGTLGLLVAFSIGRIGCTLVHDHVGHATDFALGYDYPRAALAARNILQDFSSTEPVIRAHNLGLYELLYLIPLNILALWMAFKGKPRPGGYLAIMIALVYAPVRFFLEFLRLNDTDPRYLGMTFAQWSSIAAVMICSYALYQLRKHGTIAPYTEDLGGRPGGRRATIAAMVALKGKKWPDKETSEKQTKEAKADADARQDRADAKEDRAAAKEDRAAAKEDKAEARAEAKEEKAEAKATKNAGKKKKKR
jgi:phosphatidylglycerol:prolipoprotein diacylglycerol transferase